MSTTSINRPSMQDLNAKINVEENSVEHLMDPVYWKSLGTFERQQYQNTYNNHLAMKLSGFKVPPLFFLQNNGRIMGNVKKCAVSIDKKALIKTTNNEVVPCSSASSTIYNCSVGTNSHVKNFKTDAPPTSLANTQDYSSNNTHQIKMEILDEGYNESYNPKQKIKAEPNIEIKQEIKTEIKEEIMTYEEFRDSIIAKKAQNASNPRQMFRNLKQAFEQKLLTKKDILRYAPKHLKEQFIKKRKPKILKEQIKRYPKRNRTIVNYIEPDYIDCLDCGNEYAFGECPIHGGLKLIEDSKIPEKQPFKKRYNLALFTTPKMLKISESRIEGAGAGVFTVMPIKKGDTFGPYKGDIIYSQSEAHKSGYSWEIFVDGIFAHYIDGENLKTSNWMRFVNSSDTREGQNVEAIQLDLNIYYRAIMDIDEDVELLVFYGEDYIQEMLPIQEQKKLPIGDVDKQQVINKKRIKKAKIQDHSCTTNLISNLDNESSPSDVLIDNDAIILPHNINKDDCSLTLNAMKKNKRTRKKKDNLMSTNLISNTENRSNVNYVNMNNVGLILPDDTNACVPTLSCESKKTRKEKKVDHCAVPVNLIPDIDDVSLLCDVTINSSNDSSQSHSILKSYKDSGSGSLFSSDTNISSESIVTTFSDTSKVNVQKTTHVAKVPTQRTYLDGKERLFSCDICGKRYTRKKSLSSHMKIHLEKCPHTCHICSKKFTRKSDLTRHMLIHTGEKPYECSECSYKCTFKCGLINHKRKYHVEKTLVSDASN